ncbi:formin-like protein 1 [Iris pallida]|uniref:Formin-like protein 1 n=1 Tax=Iris pallida TaxID=29817 RepID=A0AAX6F8M7_IRIPA|nr:formin-like protein 1 [Iris pallida]
MFRLAPTPPSLPLSLSLSGRGAPPPLLIFLQLPPPLPPMERRELPLPRRRRHPPPRPSYLCPFLCAHPKKCPPKPDTISSRKNFLLIFLLSL